MKQYWHTKTLFIQRWNWKYKWAYKHNHCIECWKCDFKHKWNWLCTKCRDKKRDLDPKRKQIKKKAWLKYHEKNYKPVIERKKKLKVFDMKSYQKDWRQKNYEALQLKSKAYRMKKKGINVLKMIINWKEKLFPWEWLMEKPTVTWNKFKLYEERKEEQRQFTVLRNYYTKWKEN